MKSVHANDPVRPQTAPALTVQQAAPWNLNRIAQPDLPLNGLYKYASDGTGVRVYVLDTVRGFHTDVSPLCTRRLLGAAVVRATRCAAADDRSAFCAEADPRLVLPAAISLPQLQPCAAPRSHRHLRQLAQCCLCEYRGDCSHVTCDTNVS